MSSKITKVFKSKKRKLDEFGPSIKKSSNLASNETSRKRAKTNGEKMSAMKKKRALSGDSRLVNELAEEEIDGAQQHHRNVRLILSWINI